MGAATSLHKSNGIKTSADRDNPCPIEITVPRDKAKPLKTNLRQEEIESEDAKGDDMREPEDTTQSKGSENVVQTHTGNNDSSAVLEDDDKRQGSKTGSSEDIDSHGDMDSESFYLHLIDLAERVNLEVIFNEKRVYSPLVKYILDEFYSSFFFNSSADPKEVATFRTRVAKLTMETDVFELGLKVSITFLKDLLKDREKVDLYTVAGIALGLFGNFSDVSQEFAHRLVRSFELMAHIKDFLRQATLFHITAHMKDVLAEINTLEENENVKQNVSIPFIFYLS